MSSPFRSRRPDRRRRKRRRTLKRTVHYLIVNHASERSPLALRIRRYVRRLALLLNREPSTILVVAAAIGVATGLAVIVFYRFIDLVQRVAIRSTPETMVRAVAVPVIVAVGFALSRALVKWGSRNSDGENIPDVMRAIAARGGHIKLGPVAVKTLASGIVIGTGGSVGPEGPVVVAGAASGSTIGRRFGASPDRLKTLVGAGAAAGIAAAFNAPIAGVLFASEKMLGTFSAGSFAPVVVAAVLASVVGRTAFGDDPVIRIATEYGVGSPWEILLYALLGVVAGLVAVAYARGVYRTQDLADRLRDGWLQVAAATVVVGALGVVFRGDLWGQGHESLDLAIVNDRAAWFLIALAFAKLAATCVSLAVGRVGGVFTPALFIGATLGGGFGLLAAAMLPALSLQPEAFALVGMAGLVAGSTHAPLTAMMMVFEMTLDYALILPLMLCSSIAFLVARRVHPESIYTEWLARRGIHLTHGADAALLARLSVAECFNRRVRLLTEDASLDELLAHLRESRQGVFPVVGDQNRLAGIVTAYDLRTLADQEHAFEHLVVAGDLMRAGVVIAADDSLLTAMRRFGASEASSLVVVDTEADRRVLGIISRTDLFATYERALAESSL